MSKRNIFPGNLPLGLFSLSLFLVAFTVDIIINALKAQLMSFGAIFYFLPLIFLVISLWGVRARDIQIYCLVRNVLI